MGAEKSGGAVSSGRVRCIDWLRGLAVFDMIMWHSACLLKPGLDKTTLGLLAGLVAPSFMFAAGYAISLLMVRSSGDPAACRRRAFKSLKRILEVLVIALLLKALTRSYESYWFLKIDILSSIALALLVSWPLMYLLATRPRTAAATFFLIGVASFAVAPIIPESTWHSVAVPGTSDFAPIPWWGYVFLGTSAGALGSIGLTGLALTALFILGGVFRYAPWDLLYGNAWIISNAGERFLAFGGMALGLYAIEREARDRQWKLNWPPFSFLELVGTNALTAYVLHILLLYVNLPWVHFSYAGKWSGKASWPLYWGLLGSLYVAAMLACVLWPRISGAVGALMPWNRKDDRSSPTS